MLEILNFSKTYQGVKKAVSDVSLTVEDGDLFAFIGHNGAGKTTTIKAIAGILDFEEGEILVNGKSMKDNPLECKKEIAYIPDQPVLYEHLSGIRYLNFISDVYHISSTGILIVVVNYSNLFFYFTFCYKLIIRSEATDFMKIIRDCFPLL